MNKNTRIAAIDVGSNTILMQIIENIDNGKIQILSESHGIAKLSKNIKITGEISEESTIRAIKILDKFARTCEEFEVNTIKAVATSAFREATNSKEIITKLENNFTYKPINIQVISGTEEARLSFLGAIYDYSINEKINDKLYTVIDIGGGSTEIISGTSDEIAHSTSLPIGVVKLTENFNITQPVNDSQEQEIRKYIKNELNILNYKEHTGELIAVSGTPTALTAIALEIDEYDITKVNNYCFTQKTLKDTVKKVLISDLDTLINRFGLDVGRADVLSAGSLILDEIICLLQRNSFLVSTNGLRLGVALHAN